MANRNWYEIKAIPYAAEAKAISNVCEEVYVKFQLCIDRDDSHDTRLALEVARNKLSRKYGGKYSPYDPVRLEYSAL